MIHRLCKESKLPQVKRALNTITIVQKMTSSTVRAVSTKYGYNHPKNVFYPLLTQLSVYQIQNLLFWYHLCSFSVYKVRLQLSKGCFFLLFVQLSVHQTQATICGMHFSSTTCAVFSLPSTVVSDTGNHSRETQCNRLLVFNLVIFTFHSKEK